MTFLKAMVLGLALANLGYFLWTHEISGPENAPAEAPVKSLKLVSEASPALPPAPQETSGIAGPPGAAADAGSNAVGGGAPASVKRCITLGPFRDVAEAAHAASTLRSGGYDPRQRVVDGDVWAGIWVYVPAPPTPGAAEQLLAKLKAAGIDDALEMPGPNEGSVISLGLFSEQKRAQARVSQVQALGLTPALSDRKRTGNVYWIDMDLKPTDGLLNPAALQNEAGKISRLEVKACPAAVEP
jgi:hypothetical protein